MRLFLCSKHPFCLVFTPFLASFSLDVLLQSVFPSPLVFTSKARILPLDKISFAMPGEPGSLICFLRSIRLTHFPCRLSLMFEFFFAFSFSSSHFVCILFAFCFVRVFQHCSAGVERALLAASTTAQRMMKW
ncbi:hypothetical protein IWZ00DRAFT_296375 [Phyllosticta capitalensis]